MGNHQNHFILSYAFSQIKNHNCYSLPFCLLTFVQMKCYKTLIIFISRSFHIVYKIYWIITNVMKEVDWQDSTFILCIEIKIVIKYSCNGFCWSIVLHILFNYHCSKYINISIFLVGNTWFLSTFVYLQVLSVFLFIMFVICYVCQRRWGVNILQLKYFESPL